MSAGGYASLNYDGGDITPGGPGTPSPANMVGFEESTVEAGLDSIIHTVNTVVYRVKAFEAEDAESEAAPSTALSSAGALVRFVFVCVLVAACTLPRQYRCAVSRFVS